MYEHSSRNSNEESKQIEQQFKQKLIRIVTKTSDYFVKFTSFLNAHISNEVITPAAQLNYDVDL